MMKSTFRSFLMLLLGTLMILVTAGCPGRRRFKPPARPVKFEILNTKWDDYNAAALDPTSLVWSSNRGTKGGNFEIWTVDLYWPPKGPRLAETGGPKLYRKSDGNEFGPFVLYQPHVFPRIDKPEYLIYASDRAGGKGKLDLYSMADGAKAPPRVHHLNTPANECYWTAHREWEIAYFASDREGGKYNIYSVAGNEAQPRKVEALSSSADDTAPYLFKHFTKRDKWQFYMVFASNRSGGRGEHDLWCSRITNGKWEKPRPLTFANSRHTEFRPSITNARTLIFSSNRPGGKGGFDLYYVRFESPY